MSNSRDEDLDNSNELLNLEPLWRQFLYSSSSEEKEEPVPDKAEDEVTPPRVNAPTSTSSIMSTSRQDMAALEASLAAVNQANDSVAAGRAARQHLIDIFASGQSQGQNVTPPRAPIGLAAQQPLPESAPRRINQLIGPSRIPHPSLSRSYVLPNRVPELTLISASASAHDNSTNTAETSTTSAGIGVRQGLSGQLDVSLTPPGTAASSSFYGQQAISIPVLNVAPRKRVSDHCLGDDKPALPKDSDDEVEVNTSKNDPGLVLPGAIKEREEREDEEMDNC